MNLMRDLDRETFIEYLDKYKDCCREAKTEVAEGSAIAKLDLDNVHSASMLMFVAAALTGKPFKASVLNLPRLDITKQHLDCYVVQVDSTVGFIIDPKEMLAFEVTCKNVYDFERMHLLSNPKFRQNMVSTLMYISGGNVCNLEDTQAITAMCCYLLATIDETITMKKPLPKSSYLAFYLGRHPVYNTSKHLGADIYTCLETSGCDISYTVFNAATACISELVITLPAPITESTEVNSEEITEMLRKYMVAHNVMAGKSIIEEFGRLLDLAGYSDWRDKIFDVLNAIS